MENSWDQSCGFEEIPHTADVALRVWGQDLKELFVNAARGLAWLTADPASICPEKEKSLDLSAPDAETLLVTWLGELIYLNEREGLVFTEFDLEEVMPMHLRGVVRGGRPKETRHLIKAATFSGLSIRPTERGLETTVTFDV
ncbi:MAG: archease [Gloeomargarita sp. SKYG116]|nr:archease [Gloeomargarita sp. SKYG116]MDW8401374.1 archease [Gloeomargarita sp. SKYGB_i_bin116]